MSLFGPARIVTFASSMSYVNSFSLVGTTLLRTVSEAGFLFTRAMTVLFCAKSPLPWLPSSLQRSVLQVVLVYNLELMCRTAVCGDPGVADRGAEKC